MHNDTSSWGDEGNAAKFTASTVSDSSTNNSRNDISNSTRFGSSVAHRSATGDSQQRMQVTALWCSGAQLLTGNAAGKVILRNFEYGVSPDAAAPAAEEGASKFWDHACRP